MKKISILFLFLAVFFCNETLQGAQKQSRQTSRRSYVALESPSISEQKCIEEINKVRQEYGLKPLKEWKQLSDCARKHSQNMAQAICPFGHDGFNKRAKEMEKHASLLSFGENVAYSYNYDSPIGIAVDGWMKSQGHKENILGDFIETGVGVSINKKGEFYITQLFAKRYKS